MSKRMTPDEFNELAQVLYENNAMRDDIDALLEQCLVSIDREYLDGIKTLWRRCLELEEWEAANYGRGIYS